MRKLLVLALVLSVVGLVNAGLSTQNLVTGLDAVVDDVALTVQIVATENVTTIVIGSLIPDVGALTPGFIKAGMSGGPGADPIGMGMTTYPAGCIVGMSATTGTAIGVQGTLYTFSYSDMPMVNLITLGEELEWGLSGAAVTFESGREESLIGETIVPEPMTMLLLGLGGLFLRKK